MTEIAYAYSAKPVKNPFRYGLALWRLVTQEISDDVSEAAIVEIGFARSKFGRRLAQWDRVLDHLKQTPTTARSIEERALLGPIDVQALEQLPAGSLGRLFADSCRAREINPNLVNIPPTTEEDWLLNHLFQTHDIWHVVTGWQFDLRGEVGLGGFYCGQLKSPSFFAFMFGLILLKVVWHRQETGPLFDAFFEGYRAGKSANPLFGTDWTLAWGQPLAAVRQSFNILPDGTGRAGETERPSPAQSGPSNLLPAE